VTDPAAGIIEFSSLLDKQIRASNLPRSPHGHEPGNAALTERNRVRPPARHGSV